MCTFSEMKVQLKHESATSVYLKGRQKFCGKYLYCLKNHVLSLKMTCHRWEVDIVIVVLNSLIYTSTTRRIQRNKNINHNLVMCPIYNVANQIVNRQIVEVEAWKCVRFMWTGDRNSIRYSCLGTKPGCTKEAHTS